jgi:iron complex transport system ATP-binding protein
MKILDQVECRHLAERPWQFLSQGERQRVLIGRALMARPDLLILDEPCAGLDPAAREHFLEFLNRMGRSKKAPTMIFVTHHVEEILPVFANILILKSGQVLCAGATRTTLTSANLSGALNLSAVVQKRAGRFGLVIGRRTGTRAARIL